MKYRSDIDGLRAVAVLSVILFHAGFRWFSGGYVGVDIFFVISGFLITRMILDDRADGTFAFVTFYERRARRILPALLVVLFTTLVCAWWWMYPPDLRQFAQSVIAVNVFASNIFFWHQTAYFAPAAKELPLLHTWSLGVEEQFYLAFPVCIALCWRLGRRRLFTLMALGAIASFVLSDWASRYHQSTNFYWVPTRAWELLLGTLVAFGNVRTFLRELFGQWLKQVAAASGLILVLYSIVAYDSYTPVPGIYALAPAGGTALILAFGGEATITGKILSLSPLVGVGLISYSAYLWHQPLFTFARYLSLGPISSVAAGVLSLATLLCAYATWRFVETPCRDRNRVSRARLFGAVGIATSVLLVSGVIVSWKSDVIGMQRVPQTLERSFSISRRESECFDIPSAPEKQDDWNCRVDRASSARPTFVAFGDSHAFSMLPALERVAQGRRLQGIFVGRGACVPLIGVVMLGRADHDCTVLNRRVLEYVTQAKIKDVVLIARWTVYTGGDYGHSVERYHIGTKADDPASQEFSRTTFEAALAQTVKVYTARGVRITIVEQVPLQRYAARRIYRKALLQHDVAFGLRTLSVVRSQHLAFQAFVRSVFARYHTDAHVNIVNVDDVLCSSGVCMVGDTNESYYFDDNHLSVAGAAAVSDALGRRLTLSLGADG